MNVLITGGGGFVGKYLCEYFAKKGNNVTATYRSTKPGEAENIRYIKQELSDEITVEGNFEVIIHTACSASGRKLSTDTYIRDNLDSARRLVEFANKKNIGTIIYFSTRSVYGEVKSKEVIEENDIINSDKYGMTKYLAENIFQEAENINTFGIRTPGIIGPDAHDIWLVDIVKKMNNNEKIQITDFETKNLVWIDDIAKFIDKLIIDAMDGRHYAYKVVNLACDEAVNNIEIIDAIKKRTKSKSEVEINKDNSHLFILNTDKAKKMGFVSSKPLDIVEKYLNTLYM